MSAILAKLAAEPVLVVAVVNALIDAAIGLGAPIPVEAKVVLAGLIFAVSQWYVRSKVTPTHLIPPSTPAA